MCGFSRPVARRSLAARSSCRVAARRYDVACSADGVFRAQHPGQIRALPLLPVAKHILDCVVTWQAAVRVLGSAGRTRPPTPAPQMAKEMS